MPTFMCFLNWTDQGAKNAKDANKRYQASRSMAEKLGGKLLSAYVTTGQYDGDCALASGAHHRYIRAKLRRALLAGMDACELSLAITH